MRKTLLLFCQNKMNNRQQYTDEQGHRQHRRDDHVDGVEVGRVALVILALADAEEGPQHRLDGGGKAGTLLRFHQLAATVLPAALAGLPTPPPTSKNVYDRVMVFTSRGKAGSMKNTTGIWRASWGCMVCCRKQKHSTFLKWGVVECGAELGMAWACTVRSCVLSTSYMTLASSPGWTAMLRVVGRKRHGPCELPSSSTVTVRLVSIWVLAGRTTVPSRWVSTLMPSSSHICLYTGTRA